MLSIIQPLGRIRHILRIAVPAFWFALLWHGAAAYSYATNYKIDVAISKEEALIVDPSLKTLLDRNDHAVVYQLKLGPVEILRISERGVCAENRCLTVLRRKLPSGETQTTTFLASENLFVPDTTGSELNVGVTLVFGGGNDPHSIVEVAITDELIAVVRSETTKK